MDFLGLKLDQFPKFLCSTLNKQNIVIKIFDFLYGTDNIQVAISLEPFDLWTLNFGTYCFEPIQIRPIHWNRKF